LIDFLGKARKYNKKHVWLGDVSMGGTLTILDRQSLQEIA